MPADPILALEQRTLLPVVNKNYAPRTTLMELFFGSGVAVETHGTETIQIDTLKGVHKMAPFNVRNGDPTTIRRDNFDTRVVAFPYISQEAELTVSKLLLNRDAGEGVFVPMTTDTMRQKALKQINDDFMKMEEGAQLAEEWLVSQLITGTIAYTNEDTGASFTISMGKPAANTWTVTTDWDLEAALPLNDVRTSLDLIYDNYGPQNEVVAFCDPIAAATLRLRAQKGWDGSLYNDKRVEGAGNLVLGQNYNDITGIRRLGVLEGVEFWEVNNQFLLPDGVTQHKALRDGYVEFIPMGARGTADRTMHYGMSEYMQDVLAGSYISRRFADSEFIKKRGTYVGYHRTRPLPQWEHPEWCVSMKVKS